MAGVLHPLLACIYIIDADKSLSGRGLLRIGDSTKCRELFQMSQRAVFDAL
jgi:hypothetical protein